ncbi:MAG: Conserved exported or envelope protein of unknown function [Frankiales bacterium]|nr:Conserved exported or envelope protein of unknown function [Frankiales bacterium]
MRTRSLLAAALLLAAVPLLPAAAAAGPDEALGRLVGKAAESVAGVCRRELAQGEACSALPGAHAQDLAAYRGSEVHRALALQSRLGDDLPLRTSSWVGTHNSFNSVSERPTLSHSDSNQQLSLTDQLEVDVRSLEVDVHWWPSASAGGAPAPVVCHGEAAHEGCTTERTLRERLTDVAGWLDAHPREVVLLYVEDHLDGAAGYDAGAAVLRDVLGDRLYRPADRGLAPCSDLPQDLTRSQVRATGKQAFVMSGCGTGSAWGAQVFRYRPKTEERPLGYGGYPRCGGHDPVRDDGVFLRYFEDSTVVSAAGEPVGASSVDDGLTPGTTAAAVRCGVDLFGFDQLLPTDGRLAALVWSFAPGEVDGAEGDCAVQRSSDGRWTSGPCGPLLPAACRTSTGTWRVTAPTTTAASAARCRALGAVPATPRRGREAQLLLEAQRTAGAEQVRLPLRSAGGGWS